MRQISETKITELRRAWRTFVDDDNKGFDRLYEAIAAIWTTPAAAPAGEMEPTFGHRLGEHDGRPNAKCHTCFPPAPVPAAGLREAALVILRKAAGDKPIEAEDFDRLRAALLDSGGLDEERDLRVAVDDVRWSGGGGTSDYWRGFNDGIDKLAARLGETHDGG